MCPGQQTTFSLLKSHQSSYLDGEFYLKNIIYLESLTKFLWLCLAFLFLSPGCSISLTQKLSLNFLCIYEFPCKCWVQKEFRIKHCSERAVGKKLHMQQNMLELCFDSFMTKPKNIHFFFVPGAVSQKCPLREQSFFVRINCLFTYKSKSFALHQNPSC